MDIVAFPATTNSFREETGVPDWVRQLIDESKLPAALRHEGLLQAVTVHPEPGRLIAALEQFAEDVCGKPDVVCTSYADYLERTRGPQNDADAPSAGG